MPDFYGVYDDLRVWEYLDFFARCYDVPAKRRAPMIGELLEIVGLVDKRDAYVESLSRGMRQRLCLAHTLVHDPALLILDEPASGLDPRARVEMREILRELRMMGKTILVSSHILPELGEMCTAVAIIDHGRVLRAGTINEIERSLRAASQLHVDMIASDAEREDVIAWLGTDSRVGSVLPLEAADPICRARGRLRRVRGGAGRPPPTDDRGWPSSGRILAGHKRSRGDLPQGDRTGRDDHAGRARGGGVTATTITAPPPRRGAIREFGGAVTTIMTKELRSRMRGRRAFVVLTLYLGLLAFIAYGVQAVVTPVAEVVADRGGVGFAFSEANASALIGQSIFSALALVQVVLVCVLAPAFTSGQISLEREKQTLDLLVSTPLRPGAIVVGKLLTALAFVVLMIVAAIPITAIVLMYGGASIGDMVNQQLVLLATAIGFGAVGIFASALTKRTQSATVVTYCVVIACILGSAMLFAFWTAAAQRDNPFGFGADDRAPEQIRYVNPMVAMLDVIAAVDIPGGTPMTRPLYEMFGTDLANGNGAAVDDPFGRPNTEEGPDIIVNGSAGEWWPRFAITFVAAAVVLTLASMRLVVPAGLRGRPWRRTRQPVMAGGATIEDERAGEVEATEP